MSQEDPIADPVPEGDPLEPKPMSAPLFVRKFIIDLVEGSVTAVLVLSLVIPHDLAEAQAQAAIVGTALIGAAIAAVRHAAPAALLWLREKLDVPPES